MATKASSSRRTAVATAAASAIATAPSGPTFWLTVDVSTRALQGSVDVQFVAKRMSETKVIEHRVQEDGSGYAGFVREVAAGLKNVRLNVPLAGLNADGTFDSLAAGLDELLDWPAVGAAMQTAYYRGLWEEEEKNSAPPAAG